MIFREAGVDDIKDIQVVRNSVKENTLSDPGLVSDADCEEYICRRGKGWVCEIGGTIVGFSIADLEDSNIWALFVDPSFEGKGIGRELQNLMLDWYFGQTHKTVWLSTSPDTRAEKFYKLSGWKHVGMTKSGEIKLEMTMGDWQRLRAQ